MIEHANLAEYADPILYNAENEDFEDEKDELNECLRLSWKQSLTVSSQPYAGSTACKE